MKRQPIVAVLGHVDHGKTTLLDHIRGSSVASREAGGITQHIGATEVPAEAIKEVCGTLLDKFKVSITIPGLLFIDTPGHHAFTSLRKRGGALADIAILVVDIREPLMPQAVEAIKILRLFKVPFVVAANKVDTLPGWRSSKGSHLQNFTKQKPEAITTLDNAIYKLIGSLTELNFDSERFDRVTDFTRQITIVPISAKTGEGVPELLAIIAGLAQKYMEKQLTITDESPGKGTILEVKEEPGLGITVDCILYDGKLSRGDTIALISKDGEVIQTRVRGLFRPKPLDEIREPRNRFTPIQTVTAAAGIKILAPNLEKALAGSPIQVLRGDSEPIISDLKKEIDQTRIETESAGVIVKTDTIGALEAVVNELKSLNIPIKKAAVGDITKIDVIEANVIKEEEPTYAVILGFNVRLLPEAKKVSENLKVKIFQNDVIYKLIEDYQEWKETEEKRIREAEMEGIVRPGKIYILPGYVFRHSKPVVVGVEVRGGTIKPDYPLMKEDGKPVGKIKSIQDRGEPLQEARLGSRIAVSIVGPTLGRQIHEGDTLYVDLPNGSIELLETKLKNTLSPDEEETLHEIKKIKKIVSGPWGRV